MEDAYDVFARGEMQLGVLVTYIKDPSRCCAFLKLSLLLIRKITCDCAGGVNAPGGLRIFRVSTAGGLWEG